MEKLQTEFAELRRLRLIGHALIPGRAAPNGHADSPNTIALWEAFPYRHFPAALEIFSTVA